MTEAPPPADSGEGGAPGKRTARSATGAVRGRAMGSVERAAARYARTRDRLDQSAAGHVQRRIVEVDLMNQAMILGALAFMSLIPVLVSIAALLPLGSSDGAAAAVAQRLGLDAAATRDLQALFPTRDTVRQGATWLGVALGLVSAFAWPAALQRGYELAWGLPTLGLRALWRPLLWLVSFLAVAAALLVSSPVASGIDRVVPALLGLPLVVGWAWWTQRLLLGGRIGWRLLLPGAVLIGVGLLGLRLVAGAFLSGSITQHYTQYGPLGIVFMLLSWILAFCIVMLGGAVLGATWHELKLRRATPQ